MKPVAFSRLKKISSEDEALKKYRPSDLVVQEKIDGFKIFASKQNGKVKIYTRRGKNVSGNLPDFVVSLDKSLPDNTAILGELTYELNGKQSISATQTVVMSGPGKGHPQGGRLVYYVYDILEFKGQKITKRPFARRDKILRKQIHNSKFIKIVKNYTWSQRSLALKNSLKKGGEGIVIKPKDSTYKYKRLGSVEPVGPWFKLKVGPKANLDDVYLKSYSKEKKKVVFPAYQNKDGKDFEVGKLSGLPVDIEKSIIKDIDNGKKVVVEVSFQEEMPSGKFRHMGWSRLRPDKPLKSVTTNPMTIPVDNPRPSKVKNALAAEAVRHEDFEEFAKKYWLDCARGIYWYATNDSDFKIRQKERELSEAKKFVVSCNPEFAFAGAANENKKYVAELNVNNLNANDFEVVRGSDGNKIKIISNIDLVDVTRILEKDKSFRSWKYQQSILPSSKEQLKSFWKDAHKKHKILLEKQAKRAKRAAKKEKRKLEKDIEKRYSNPLSAGMQLPPRHGGPTVVKGKKAQYSYAGRDGDYDLYQTGNVMIGVIDMAVQEPEYDWQGASDRFYAYNTHSYHEGFKPTMDQALDAAFVGYPNPRVKNPTPFLNPGPTDKFVTVGIRQIPRYVNNPKY